MTRLLWSPNGKGVPAGLAMIRKDCLDAFLKPGLKAGTVFRLHPRHPIFVRVGYRAEGGERFARLFRETWRRLPLCARRTILAYWRCEPIPALPIKPDIELLSYWPGQRRGRGLRSDKAAVYHHGYSMKFWWKIVAAYPDNVVMDLIAHELAHVIQYGVGYRDVVRDGRPVTIDPDGEELSMAQVEEYADWIAQLCGFEPWSIDDWDLEHGVTRFVDLDRVSASTRRRLLREQERCGR